MGSSRRRIRIYGLAAAVGLGVLAGSAPAGASIKGRRNTAYALTAVAVYAMATGKTKTGLVAGAGAAYAWKRAIDQKKALDRRAAAERRARYCRSGSSRYGYYTPSHSHHSRYTSHHRTTVSCRAKPRHHASKSRGRLLAEGHHKHRQYAYAD